MHACCLFSLAECLAPLLHVIPCFPPTVGRLLLVALKLVKDGKRDPNAVLSLNQWGGRAERLRVRLLTPKPGRKKDREREPDPPCGKQPCTLNPKP